MDLHHIGLTVDDLDLDTDLPALPLDRPRWQPAEHWMTSDAESHLADLPMFDSHADRARWFIEQMGQRALRDGQTRDDAVLPHGEKLVSLNELVSSLDEFGVDQAISFRLER